MAELDLTEVRTQLGDLRPADDRYSVILVNRNAPLSDPDCATKGYETNDLPDLATLPNALELSVVAIRDDGAVIELS